MYIACFGYRRFFERAVKPNTYAIQESNGISEISLEKAIKAACHAELVSASLATTKYIIQTYKDAKEFGSIIDVEKRDYDSLKDILVTWKENHEATLENVLIETDVDYILPLIEIAKVMSTKYDVVVTNPPYMGASGMGEHLSNFVKKNYPDSKSDLFAVFIEKCGTFAKKTGLISMITQHAWMFLSSYEKLRTKLNERLTLNMAHLGARAFDEIGGEVVQTTAFISMNQKLQNYRGTYKRLVDFAGEAEKEAAFADEKNTYFAQQENFAKIPGMPIAYWVSKNAIKAYNNCITIGQVAHPRLGFATGDNERFMRLWFEVFIKNIGFRFSDRKSAQESGLKWFPTNKGGESRKWYGNIELIVNWQNDGYEIRNFKDEKGKLRSRPQNLIECFSDGVTWTVISNINSFRFSPSGMLYNNKGPILGSKGDKKNFLYLGFLNSIVTNYFLKIQGTIGFEAGYISTVPYSNQIEEKKSRIRSLVEQNISLSKLDWDAFETSWDFTKHPLLPVASTSSATELFNSISISDCYSKWEGECSERFARLKSNEEELNRIFIEIYGLQDELTPEVLDKDVTVRLADRTRDIKSFISYAVGCMFGRYSLSKEGLAYAGGDMDMNNYKYFIPDADNVIPVTDEEYFNDDIVTRFVEFVRQVYGESTLEENLRFIAESLPNKGDTPKEVIRSYFLNDFYKDHCKIYQKRPIYWLFDSGKENGFKALIYMHRYDNQTLARVRTDYLHKLQKMYDAALIQCKQIAENTATAARDKAFAIKRIAKITKQLEETKLYDQALGHIASQYIDIDLDDGVNVNYEKFQGVQVAREGQKAIKIDILAKRG